MVQKKRKCTEFGTQKRQYIVQEREGGGGREREGGGTEEERERGREGEREREGGIKEE